MNGTTGFRGWSGGFRNNFTISPETATPGYIPGYIEPGEWNVVLGPYTSNPGGIDYQLDVTIGFDPVKSYFQTAFAPSVVGPILGNVSQSDDEDLNSPKGSWHRGDLHMHTYYSDGRYSPSEIIAYALRRQLAFIFSTDHNTQASDLVWGTLAPPNLLIGRGIEVTTRNGHWGALGLEWNQWTDFRYHANDAGPGLIEAKQQVRKAGGFVSINHPYSTCGACNWTFSYDDFDGIEVWNGPWDPTDQLAVNKWQELLVQGVHITAVGGSDAHRDPDVVGRPTTVVRAASLTTNNILDGMRRRRAYLVRDPGMDIQFSVGGDKSRVHTQVGDTVTDGGNLTAILHTAGLEGGNATFISETGVFHQSTIREAREVTVEVPRRAKWVRVEVRNGTDAADMLGLTNPVFLQ
jgi:hypothetical protein